jgi:hypothetical protein
VNVSINVIVAIAGISLIDLCYIFAFIYCLSLMYKGHKGTDKSSKWFTVQGTEIL